MNSYSIIIVAGRIMEEGLAQQLKEGALASSYILFDGVASLRVVLYLQRVSIPLNEKSLREYDRLETLKILQPNTHQ